jgi:enoyl-CoA hydratase
MSFKNIKIQVENNVAIMSLARNEHINALSVDFAYEITGAVKSLMEDAGVRVIILNSDARIFCAGLDLKALSGSGMDGTPKTTITFPQTFEPMLECCNIMEKCPKPIIAAVHGKCVGGGLDIISACDIRMCTEDATFSLREVAIGIAADMGVLQRLPYIIGQGFTREMAYTAKFFTAREVERMGLMNHVYPDKETMMREAKKLADEIASMPPLAVQNTKDIMNFSRNITIHEGMMYAIHKNMVLFFADDTKEALTAFMEKRNPVFKGE